MSKILIISPIPTHPPTAGNKARILDICLSLKEKGYELDYFYIYKGKGEGIEETKAFFGKNNFHAYKSQHRNYWSIFQSFFYFLSKKSLFTPSIFFNYPIDFWIDKRFSEILLNLFTINKYKAVIAEYVFCSKYLEVFPNSVKKIIDTHDKFTDRWQIFHTNNRMPYGPSASKNEEQKGLNRADIIIAIQNNEARYFREISHKPVITYGYKIHNKVCSHEFSKNLLYLGVKNNLNISGIDNFLDNCFPFLIQKEPEIKLFVGGTICNYLQETRKQNPNIKLLGFVKNIDDFYDIGSIVINPMPFGTGLKIKSIEALSYSKYLVTTPTGADGMEKGINKAFFVANTPIEFSEYILSIIEKENIRNQLDKNIKIFIEEWNKMMNENFNKLVDFITSN